MTLLKETAGFTVMVSARSVCLRFEPDIDGSRQVFKGLLSEVVIQSSGVLSRIIHGTGEGDLPRGITLEAFKAWLDVIQEKNESSDPLSLQMACIAIKAGSRFPRVKMQHSKQCSAMMRNGLHT